MLASLPSQHLESYSLRNRNPFRFNFYMKRSRPASPRSRDGSLGAQDRSSFEVSVHPPDCRAEAEGEMSEVDAWHEIIQEWRSLPKEQRQTDEQAAAFAMQIKYK
jgi:hypothetical protein